MFFFGLHGMKLAYYAGAYFGNTEPSNNNVYEYLMYKLLKF